MASSWPQFEFNQPEWLWLLLCLPFLWLVFRRTLVDLSQRQLIAGLVVRGSVCSLLVLALSGLTILKSTDRVFVVFAVDQSLSVDEKKGRDVAQQFIDAATARVEADRFSVLPFASIPGALHTDNHVPTLNNETRNATDLQSALNLGVAGVPPGFVPHVVLLSDGNETIGDVRTALSTIDCRVSTVPLPTRSSPEIQVTRINVPAQVAEGQPFNVEVVVDANHDDTASIEIFNGDIRVMSETKTIKSGENKFVFSQQVSKPTEFAARIRRPTDSGADTFRDTLGENNVASGLVFTTGKSRVLLIERNPELARNLEWAMDEEGISIETRPPEGMPESLTELQNYDALILSDVPATGLSEEQMDTVRKYVSELGGGFLMLGGDESFGLGGYYKTVIEDILPVRCDFEKEKEKPGLAMALIMDKSGSMGGQKIELAKEAARAAVDLLGEKDQIGVIAFDGSPYWVSEMSGYSQKGAVMDRISSITAGGGTTLYPAMEEAFQALRAADAKLKHVIILTDGYSTPGDFEGITQELSAARVTVSTIGIGDADQEMLELIAQQGGGRYYFTDDPGSIPQIFARETITASKSAIKEEPFLPLLVRATPALQDINLDEAPFLLGYVVTRTKATSEVILTTESGDPLLAWWRYGLGMSVAFTSDAKSRWAAEWLTWPGFNQFWAQVIRHASRKSESKGFAIQIERDGPVSRVVVDSFDDVGQFLNSAETELSLTGPDLQTTRLNVPQTAPGRYETVVDTPSPGAWHFQVTQKQNGKTIYQQTRGMVAGYSEELRIRQTNQDLLNAIADESGGQFQPSPTDVFAAKPTDQASTITALWPSLLTAAMILFVFDVALRRLDLSRYLNPEAQSRSRDSK